MAAMGIMGAEYTVHNHATAGITLEENPYRRYLAVFSSADTVIKFYTGGNYTGEFTLPANMPWSPLTSPTNMIVIQSDGTGLIMEA